MIKVQEGKILKILTPIKVLTKLPVLLSQIKAGNNSNKLKNKIRQMVHFCISIIKSRVYFYDKKILIIIG